MTTVFFPSLSQTFATQVHQRGHCPAIISTRRDELEEREAVTNLISYAVEALFIVGATNPDALSKMCRNADLPHVFVDQPCQLAPSVVTDNHAGAQQLSDQLLNTMHKANNAQSHQLYFLGGDASLPASAQRINGFKQSIKHHHGRVDASQIIACGYDKHKAAEKLIELYRDARCVAGGLTGQLYRLF